MDDVLTSSPLLDWDLLEPIGKGSYGSVHRARLKRVGTLAAIKTIALEDNDNEIASLSQDVVREVETLKKCAHAAVLGYLGAYIFDRKLWLVTELCEGGSVLDVMRQRNAPLDERQVTAVAASSIVALSYLHSQRITHRDVKAANLLLTASGQLKLADFGVSVELTNALATRSTAIGTPHWMAPEVVQEGQYDEKADLWSLGITIIEVAQMLPPHWDVRPVVRVLLRIPSAPPPTLQHPMKWSHHLIDWLKLCLKKEPSERPTAAELSRHALVASVGDAETVILDESATRLKPLLEEVKAAKARAAQSEASSGAGLAGGGETLEPTVVLTAIENVAAATANDDTAEGGTLILERTVLLTSDTTSSSSCSGGSSSNPSSCSSNPTGAAVGSSMGVTTTGLEDSTATCIEAGGTLPRAETASPSVYATAIERHQPVEIGDDPLSSAPASDAAPEAGGTLYATALAQPATVAPTPVRPPRTPGRPLPSRTIAAPAKPHHQPSPQHARIGMNEALRNLTDEDCVRLVLIGMGNDDDYKRVGSPSAHEAAVAELCSQAKVGGLRAVRQIFNSVLIGTDAGPSAPIQQQTLRAGGFVPLKPATISAVLRGLLFGASTDEGIELFGTDGATVESIFGLALGSSFDADVRREASLVLLKLADHPSARAFLRTPEALHGLRLLIRAATGQTGGGGGRARGATNTKRNALELSAVLQLTAAALEPPPPPPSTSSDGESPPPNERVVAEERVEAEERVDVQERVEVEAAEAEAEAEKADVQALARKLLLPLLYKIDVNATDPNSKRVREALEACRQRLDTVAVPVALRAGVQAHLQQGGSPRPGSAKRPSLLARLSGRG